MPGRGCGGNALRRRGSSAQEGHDGQQREASGAAPGFCSRRWCSCSSWPRASAASSSTRGVEAVLQHARALFRPVRASSRKSSSSLARPCSARSAARSPVASRSNERSAPAMRSRLASTSARPVAQAADVLEDFDLRRTDGVVAVADDAAGKSPCSTAWRADWTGRALRACGTCRRLRPRWRSQAGSRRGCRGRSRTAARRRRPSPAAGRARWPRTGPAPWRRARAPSLRLVAMALRRSLPRASDDRPSLPPGPGSRAAAAQTDARVSSNRPCPWCDPYCASGRSAGRVPARHVGVAIPCTARRSPAPELAAEARARGVRSFLLRLRRIAAMAGDAADLPRACARPTSGDLGGRPRTNPAAGAAVCAKSTEQVRRGQSHCAGIMPLRAGKKCSGALRASRKSAPNSGPRRTLIRQEISPCGWSCDPPRSPAGARASRHRSGTRP